jgi:hypothetical protein
VQTEQLKTRTKNKTYISMRQDRVTAGKRSPRTVGQLTQRAERRTRQLLAYASRSEKNQAGLSHGVTRQNTSEEFDWPNILAPNILALKEAGKNMGGKNIIEILEQVNRRS